MGSQNQGWGCAAGGPDWAERRLTVLGQWLCQHGTATLHTSGGDVSGRKLLAIEMGFTPVTIAPSHRTANTTLLHELREEAQRAFGADAFDLGQRWWTGLFYREVGVERVMRIRC